MRKEHPSSVGRSFKFALFLTLTTALAAAFVQPATATESASAAVTSLPLGIDAVAPEPFIQDIMQKGVSLLNDASKPLGEKEKIFRQILQSCFHLKSIAGAALRSGEARREAPERLDTYLGLFEAMIFRVYMKQLEQLTLQGFQITGVTDTPDGGKLVQSTIQRVESSESLKVDWALYQHENRFWIFDIVIDGVSLSQIQRQKIQDIRQGGDLGVLIERMQRKYASDVLK